jgi:hypothetical protein
MLVMVFAIPLAPVVQVGNYLFQNQFSEEISVLDFFPVKQGDAAQQENISDIFLPLARHSTEPDKMYWDETLCSRQADDISTPPPNS